MNRRLTTGENIYFLPNNSKSQAQADAAKRPGVRVARFLSFLWREAMASLELMHRSGFRWPNF